jgi:hypothetical protein
LKLSKESGNNQESKTSAAFMIVDDDENDLDPTHHLPSPACNQQSTVFKQKVNDSVTRFENSSSQRVPTVMQINSNMPPSRTANKFTLL